MQMKLNSGNIPTIQKVTLTGLIVTLGIIYGDIGTSPLYVVDAILSQANDSSPLLIYGSLSCVFWTLTLQTTVKYILITIRANNKGEGGIFSLFALTKKKTPAVAILTMIGASALLADGIITPSITVSSAIEGVQLFNKSVPVIPIVLLILTTIFFFQQFGTHHIGKYFGPLMIIWLTMIGTLGLIQIAHYPEILRAASPRYAFEFLTTYPKGFILLGAVFLCTTGAEALYSDLGHCGLNNIRITWIFVKTSLLLNYFGQMAWIMHHNPSDLDLNPFYALMPSWFLVPGIIISTFAAVIASQALISGSFTLISEGISLNFWPKNKILHPTDIKGQVYIPAINTFLWLACCFSVIYFRKSTNMEAAYGLSITLAMIMTTLLLTNYMKQRRFSKLLIASILVLFLTIEISFLVANLHKFVNGGYYTIIIATGFFLIMYGWYFGRKIKNKYISYVKLSDYYPLFCELKKDKSAPKICSNLVYIMKANYPDQVESKIMYSIFNKQPKRADRYWLLHVNTVDAPDTFTYSVEHLIPDTLIKIDFNLGFKMERRLNLYFREVLEDMERTGETKLISSFDSLKSRGFQGDFLFINIERIMTRDYKLSPWETFVMNLHRFTRTFSNNDVKALGLDSSSIIEEKVPISIERNIERRIQRIQPRS
jgi:KUP system potassium uptake protein